MSATQTPAVQIVEVGPRDGLQPIGPWIPTETKLSLLRGLAAAGVRRVEAGAFVSPTAVPQMRDAADILAAAGSLPGLDLQMLVPSAPRGMGAVAAGATHLAFVLSVSEAHNQSNVRRNVAASIAEYGLLLSQLPPGVRIRLNLATTFDCPFTGQVPDQLVLDVLEQCVPLRTEVEIGLCDTTGRAAPDHVARLAGAAQRAFPQVTAWAFHGHDTYGLGLANVHAAWASGIRVIDAAFGGLGGCPFAPGATGNVATEDVVWMFHRMGVPTGIDLPALLDTARTAAALPGASPGGRVRDALAACAAGGAEQAVAQ